MSITSAKTGSTGLSLALDNNYMEPIATVLVGASGSSTIEFAGIPQGYKHLQIRGIAKTTRSGTNNYVNDLNINFNLDYSNSYSAHGIYAFGSTYAYGSADTGSIFVQSASADGDGAIPNNFGAFVIDISDYGNTNKFKTLKASAGTITTSSYVDIIALNSGSYRNTSAIENIKIRAAFSFKQHSRFSLYGIKG